MIKRLSCLILVWASACSAAPAPAPKPAAAPSPSELDRAVADLCDKQIVFLGEAAHGDGSTIEAKTRIATRLIESCGFDSVFIEAGVYDFLALERAYAAGTATSDDLANAIGALWSDTEEVQPLIGALHGAASAGRIKILGLDDQISSTAVFAQEQLPGVITAYLDGERRAECQARIARHTSWTYSEEEPYDETANAALVACLHDARAAIAARESSDETAVALVMTESLLRMLARDFGVDGREAFNARDASMFENFQWHRRRLGPQSKSIVWSATIHAAKSLDGAGRYSVLVPLGQHVRLAYGDGVAAIGFSAYAGATRQRGKEPTALEVAPADSLEGQAVAPEQELRYLDAESLRGLGAIAARPIGHEFVVARWDGVLDGLIVLREERPARPLATP